jgi:predicted aconitase with swiveling domain
MLFNEMTTKIARGAVVTHAPAVTDFDRDPLEVIETGDWVRVDADQGIIEVTKSDSRLGEGNAGEGNAGARNA